MNSSGQPCSPRMGASCIQASERAMRPHQQLSSQSTKNQAGGHEMAEVDPQLLDKIRAAAQAARHAADSAQAYAEQIAAGASVASGGAVDPFIFRLAIFPLAVVAGFISSW